MSKPPTRRVNSDGCIVTIDGVETHPHEGEWVEVVGLLTLTEQKVFWNFNRLSGQLAALVGAKDGLEKQSDVLDAGYEAACMVLGHRIVAWNWTDDWGKPLAAPDGTMGPILGLHAEEIYYLRDVAQDRVTAAPVKKARVRR